MCYVTGISLSLSISVHGRVTACVSFNSFPENIFCHLLLHAHVGWALNIMGVIRWMQTGLGLPKIYMIIWWLADMTKSIWFYELDLKSRGVHIGGLKKVLLRVPSDIGSPIKCRWSIRRSRFDLVVLWIGQLAEILVLKIGPIPIQIGKIVDSLPQEIKSVEKSDRSDLIGRFL